jgi:hypothetical protein
MSVEDLILLNNIDIFKDNNIKIKIFLLDKILNNIELIKYKFCIDYFVLNNDINFIDSLINKNIALILFNCLNDSVIKKFFDENQIIISKSLNIFNNELIYDLNIISFKTLNISYDPNYIHEKLQSIVVDNILKSIHIIDDIFNYINNNIPSHPKLINIYNKIINIVLRSKNELLRRKKYLDTIIEKIYYLLNDKNLAENENIVAKENLINSIRIIVIIRNKVYELFKEDITDISENINIIFENDRNKIMDIIKIFNNDQITDNEINDYKIHLKNICKIYNNINKYNIDNIDIIEFIENLYTEIEDINSILEISNNNDIYFEELFNNLILIPNDNRILLNIIKQFIKFIEFMNNNDFILSIKESYENESISLDEKKYLKNEIDEIKKIFNNQYFEYLFLIFNIQFNINNTTYKIKDMNIYKDELIENTLNNDNGDLESINDLICELNENILNEELKLNLYEEQLERYISKKLI